MEQIAAKYIWPVALAIFAVLAPIHSVLLAVGVLIMGDMVLGVLAARKRKDEITSARLRDTVSKMFIFQVVLILGFVFEKFLLNDYLPVVKIIASAIGIAEMKSILENSSAIVGQPIFEYLINKLGSKNRH